MARKRREANPVGWSDLSTRIPHDIRVQMDKYLDRTGDTITNVVGRGILLYIESKTAKAGKK